RYLSCAACRRRREKRVMRGHLALRPGDGVPRHPLLRSYNKLLACRIHSSSCLTVAKYGNFFLILRIFPHFMPHIACEAENDQGLRLFAIECGNVCAFVRSLVCVRYYSLLDY